MKLKAKIHDILQKQETPFDHSRVTIEPGFTEERIKELKILHEEWFPVVYDERFYNQIRKGDLQVVLMLYSVPPTKKKYKPKTYIIGAVVY